jgi:transcriptional regulator with XRE-family HTH domain
VNFFMSNKRIPRLRQERERRGWSRNYVAERIQVDVVTIGRWERGQRLPYPIYRQKLCDLFEMNAEQLGLFWEHAQQQDEDAVDLDGSSHTDVLVGGSEPQDDGDASDAWNTRNVAVESSRPNLTPQQETIKGKTSSKTWRSFRLAQRAKPGFLVVLTILLLVVVVGFGAYSRIVSPHMALCPPSCAHPINGCPKSQAEGAHNAWVKVLQYRLNYYLRSDLQVDGAFGSATKVVVSTFQSRAGISGGGGIVDGRTWAAMGFCLGFSNIIQTSGTTALTNCPPSQSNRGRDTSIFVQAIQDMLNVDFYTFIFPDSPELFPAFLTSNGSFVPYTQNAVTDFQHALGLSGGGGIVGQRTWSELGMCS